MKIYGIIQARMGSTRLPGKVLKDVGGRSMLSCVVKRLQRAKRLDGVVVATSTQPSDDLILEECDSLGVSCFRGSERDVLERYYQAANYYQVDGVARVTGDCPLIDPDLADRVVRAFRKQKPDCASNTLDRTYPRGLGLSVISMKALSRAHQEAQGRLYRAHPPLYIHHHPDLFNLISVKGEVDYSHLRWTVDMEDDLRFVREIYQRFNNQVDFSWREVITLLEHDPSLMVINQHISQKDPGEG